MLHRAALWVVAAVLVPLCWAGPGLRGEYYANATLSGSPVLTRTDPMVTFASTGSPGAGVPAENFSVRWTGQVQAPATAAYRFSTFTDDVGNRGVWVPSISLDQYAATMVSWFGMPDASLTTVFPNLGNFAAPKLGFI